MTDRDPCQGCTHLMHPEGLRPWCAKHPPRGPIHQPAPAGTGPSRDQRRRR